MRCTKCNFENPEGASVCGQCGETLAAGGGETVVVGQIRDELAELQAAVKNKYSIVKEIGRGGMAVVYEAVDLSLERNIALKVLPKEFTYDRQFVDRFKQEIKTLAKIDHPHIIPLYSAEEVGGFSFFSMKYIEGRTLKQVIEQQGAVPIETTLKIARDVCKALSFAHGKGVLHRDLKPDNIMTDNDFSHAYIMDFGIAKALEGSKVTKEGTTVGTVEYMSPEQCKGGELDARSDLYSLGVVLFEMLTAKVPFDGETTACMYKQVHEKPPQMRKLNPNIPADLQAIVESLLEKDKDKRPASAGDLLSLLDNVAFGGGKGGSVKKSKAAPKVKTPGKPVNKKLVAGVAGGLLVAGLVTAFIVLGIAGVFRVLGQYETAIEKYSEIIKNDAGNASAYKHRASCYGKINKPDLMIADYNKAFSLDPGLAPKKFTVNVAGMDFVYVPKGSFKMGRDNVDDPKFADQAPGHQVSVSAFWIARYETTQQQYQAVMGSNPSQLQGANYPADKFPVNNVSWYDALSFCTKFSDANKVKARLPYEAEWEYACRAGSTTLCFWGDSENDICKFGNANKTLCKGKFEDLSPIGLFSPNDFGLYDMIGNVWEWCGDWYDPNYYKGSPNEDPTGPAAGAQKVMRGQSFTAEIGFASSLREASPPSEKAAVYGFRVVISGKPAAVSVADAAKPAVAQAAPGKPQPQPPMVQNSYTPPKNSSENPYEPEYVRRAREQRLQQQQQQQQQQQGMQRMQF